ncbi:MAG: alpha/beta fold hydrolase [Micrococcus sp.]|nr:alpha/beta fold hydrolase [Micrococcus sp.]
MIDAVPGDPRTFAPPAPAAHRPGLEAELLDGTLIADHWFEVPLDHAAPGGRSLTVFAREYVAAAHRGRRRDLPWLLFLQGGPGSKGMRQARLSGWMRQAAKDFRILMLDQRGTGLSSPVTRNTLPAEGSPGQQAEYLVHFRAPSIVQDAEAIRLALGSGPWTVFGQSFGGFCTLSYLSWHPEGVARALITGGLAPLDGHAEQVYRATYRRMRYRNEEYFSRFPQDRDVLARVYEAARGGGAALPDGSPVTVGRVQALGMFLGGNTRMDQLHYLLQEAFDGPRDSMLSDTFLHGLYQQVSRAVNPLYLVMHESIYAQPASAGAVRSDTGGTDTGWAAQRVLAGSGELADFDPDRSAAPLLTGEMVFEWYTDLDPALRPLGPAAEALARRSAWGPLYDLDALAANTVPAAAAVYTHDVYVDRDLSLQTAGRVRCLTVWETDEFHHDGIGDDGPAILKRLLGLTG